MTVSVRSCCSFVLDGVTAKPVTLRFNPNPGLSASAELRVAAADGSNPAWARELRVILQAAVHQRSSNASGLVTVDGVPKGASILGIEHMMLDLVTTTEPVRPAVANLSLSGELRPVRGALILAEAYAQQGARGLICSPDDAREVALAGVEPRVFADVKSSLAIPGVEAACDQAPGTTRAGRDAAPPDARDLVLDFADISDTAVVTAATIAAAGGHSLLMMGPPTAANTMVARRIPAILPPMTGPEALAVTRARSAAGLNTGQGLATQRPFRAPHHSCSLAGLVGGGAPFRLGEASLSGHGVLFLDAVDEFARAAREVLGEIRDGRSIDFVRASGPHSAPGAGLLVASIVTSARSARAAGAAGSIAKEANPVLESLRAVFDIFIKTEPQTPDTLGRLDTAGRDKLVDRPPSGSTASLREQVKTARDRQAVRGCVNAVLPLNHPDLTLTDDAQEALEHACPGELREQTTRPLRDKVLRVARTAADMEDSGTIEAQHIRTALALAL